MGFFDSVKKTANETETTEVTTNNLDNKVIGDDTIVGGNTNLTLGSDSSTGSVTVVNTDYGAIASGNATAKNAVSGALDFGGKALDFAEETSDNFTDFGIKVADKSFDTSREIVTDSIQANKSLAASAINSVENSYKPAGATSIDNLVKVVGAVLALGFVVWGAKYAK